MNARGFLRLVAFALALAPACAAGRPRVQSDEVTATTTQGDEQTLEQGTEAGDADAGDADAAGP